MRTRVVVLMMLVSLALFPRMSSAHHQLDKTYVRERTIVLTGTVTAAQWINPHVVLTVAVKDGAGKVQAWRVELDPPNALIRRGWKRDQPAVGAVVTVTAVPSIDGGPASVARTITLASGERLEATTDGSWNWREMGKGLTLPGSINKP